MKRYIRTLLDGSTDERVVADDDWIYMVFLTERGYQEVA